MSFAAKILADSISPAGHRLTTFECVFPRIVLAELNTHRMLSRNSASSRAMPVAGRIKALEEEPFVPEAFGRNQKGMQPGDALDGAEGVAAANNWRSAVRYMITHAKHLAELGVHKQYANRLLEPFSWHTAVITATDLDNFFHLRINPAAQGEFQRVAELMYEAREKSTPLPLDYSDWHLPYVDLDELIKWEERGFDTESASQISAARCARVSYLTQDGRRDVGEDLAFYTRLVAPGHLSPLEHPARPMTEVELRITRTFDISIDGGPMLRSGAWSGPLGTGPDVGSVVPGLGKITTVRGPLYYCGNLNGWISRRAHVPGEHDILGHRSQEEAR